MPTLISLISDQPIPNLLFIKQMEQPDLKFVMLSTEDMEQKKIATNIATAANLSVESYVVYKISHADPEEILRKMESISWDKSEQFIVNITGGTKIMSQMVYQFFTSNPFNVAIYYTPIAEPYWTILYPKLKTVPIGRDYQLTLSEYFLAHGFLYTFLQGLRYPISEAKSLMNQTIQKKGAYNVAKIKAAKTEIYKGEDKMYLMGEWFEEWCYAIFRDDLNLANDQIAMGIQIKNILSEKKAVNDNEIDVAFVYNNRLYLIECKVFNKMDSKKIGETVYKAASIRQTLGLQATSMIMLCCLMGKNDERKLFVSDICRMMHVRKVFSLEDMKDKNLFISQIKKMINYGK